ncbi:DUF3617 family protein [Caulobacter sp. BK020]|uniref:DUF3617 domain-containing protein n=1 Tax=Caulobacter sp. BK020 TaxID=2512117 RepID=UPI0010429CD9|nr:DUF3617 family protein [Caulobacter sp. BK020]TCS16652.1 hypothetical protein EV278_103158 [Caulobacter sp. BK020]
MRTLLVFVAFGTLAAAAACGQKSATQASGSGAAEGPKAATTAPAAATPAPTGWPKRKPGLWTQTMTLQAQGFTRSFRFCVDATSDEKMGLDSQGDDKRCQRKSMTRGADGSWTVVSACDMGPAGKTDSTIHVAGDFDTRYVMEVASTTTGAAQPAMNGEHKMSMTAEWSGACPAGWSGGDVEMPGGRRINLLTKAVSGG